MDISLSGKTAIVTGGSRGIGLASAASLARAGASVMITSRKAADLEDAARQLAASGLPEERVAWTASHVGHPEDAERCVATTVERFGHVDILINNAATNPYFGPMLDISGSQAQKTLEVNQLAVLTWTSAAHRSGALGSVINMSSIGGVVVEPDLGWYNTTKAALLHMTRQLSIELAPNVRVNAIAPGLVKTQFAAALWEGRDEERIARSIPLRRLGTVDDIADAVVFLSSDRASWITGQTLVVDGGTSLARTRLSVT